MGGFWMKIIMICTKMIDFIILYKKHREKDELVSSLSVFQQYIKDYESQLTNDVK